MPCKPAHVKSAAIACAIGGTLLLSGCGSSSSHDSTTRTYEISVSNRTANQPFSPIAVVLHETGYTAWVDGESASVPLEVLAEGGDNTALLTDASNSDFHLASGSGSAAIGPGTQESIQLDIASSDTTHLSVISMLVNTNDAYTGVNAASIHTLAQGESLSFSAPVWDAGTEDDSEAAGAIPGPADGGEGYNAARSDNNDRVRFHSGIISNQDGLADSVLNGTHRFDNPAATITITRLD